MVRVRNALGAIYDRLHGAPTADYAPASYWEGRATDLIEGYDHPESWERRGWMRGEVEEGTVPALLHRGHVETVLVPGAGTGRQYRFLIDAGFRPSGFDISETLVRVCRERFPTVQTNVGSVVNADEHEELADAVVTSAVLQHVRPSEINAAVAALKALALNTVVVRELTRLEVGSQYQFVHDYGRLFFDWEEIYRAITDESEVVRVELFAWRRT
jgi:hypothetical protein